MLSLTVTSAPFSSLGKKLGADINGPILAAWPREFRACGCRALWQIDLRPWPFHQGRRDLAIEVRVSPGLIVECVENGERGRPLLNGEPRGRARFSVDQRYGGTQEIRDLILFARLRLQRNVKGTSCHRFLLLRQCIPHFVEMELRNFRRYFEQRTGRNPALLWMFHTGEFLV